MENNLLTISKIDGEARQVILERTGYDVAIDEHYDAFVETLKEIKALLKHPDYMQIAEVSTIRENLLRPGQCLTMQNIRNFISTEYASAQVVMALTELCSMLNIGKNMTEEQIQLTAAIIVKDDPYCNFTLKDLKLCFKFLLCGKYGKLYDRLDPAVIFDAMNQSNEQKKTVKRYLKV